MESELWSAVSETGQVIPEGEDIQVIQVSSAVLTVVRREERPDPGSRTASLVDKSRQSLRSLAQALALLYNPIGTGYSQDVPLAVHRGEVMAALPTRQLGRTGLQVTRLAYGAMELRGGSRGPEVTPQQAQAILNAVLDAGINYIDTSIDYGESEEVIGRYLSHHRSEYFLATKCGCQVGPRPPGGGRMPHVFTRENIVAGVHQSLTRMKTDYIDVLQFHAEPSKETLEQERAVETLLDLQRDGKIRFHRYVLHAAESG